MNRIYSLIFALILIFSVETNAQEISVNIQSRYGILTDYSIGGRGGSFGIDYLYTLKPKLQTIIGTEMSFVPWGMDLTHFAAKTAQNH